MKKSYSHYLFACLTFIGIGFITACSGETQPAETEATNEQTITEVPPEFKLNINTASDEAFSTIPDVGDNMVHEFNEYAPYVSIREFRQEIGKYVDEAQVAEYEQYIYVPINYNTSDAATLQQIPGLDASEAEELAAGRPYEAKQAFIDALSSYVNEQQMEVAKRYIED